MLSELNFARGNCLRPLRHITATVRPAREGVERLSHYSSQCNPDERSDVCWDTLRACARLSFLHHRSDAHLGFSQLIRTCESSVSTRIMSLQICVAIAEACDGKTGENRTAAGLPTLRFVLSELQPQPGASEAHYAAWHQAIQALIGSKEAESVCEPHIACLMQYPKIVGTILTGLHAFPKSPWISALSLRTLRILYWSRAAPSPAVMQTITMAVVGAMSNHAVHADVQLAALRLFQDMEDCLQSSMRCMMPTVMLCARDALIAHSASVELQCVGLSVMASYLNSSTEETSGSVVSLAVECVIPAMESHSQHESVQLAVCRLLEAVSATGCLTDPDAMLSRLSTIMDVHKDSPILLDAAVSALVSLLDQQRRQRSSVPTSQPSVVPTPLECVDVTDLDCVYAPQPVQVTFSRRRVSDTTPK